MSWKVSRTQYRALLILLSLALVLLLLSHAAVIDDAHITLRVVDNFTSGYGLRWNTDERVQVYSHPLWMLLHIPVYAVVGNLYLSNILLSAICAISAVLLLFRLVPNDAAAMALVLIPLILSKVFLSYAMCGLETPLLCCLLAWFVNEWVRPTQHMPRLCFIISLCLITRLDTVTLLLPGLVVVLWRARALQSWRRIAIAFAPLLLWSAFCLVYYGFVFPNTRYAKLSTGLAAGEHAVQGVKYFYNFAHYDSFSWLLVMVALCLGCRRHEAVPGALACGIALNIAYVIGIGGDYMCGRFFVPVFFWSLCMLAFRLRAEPVKRLSAYSALSLAVFITHRAIIMPLFPSPDQPASNFGINDSTAKYYSINGLFSDSDHFIRTGITDAAAIASNLFDDPSQRVVVHGFVGYTGFYAPHDKILIDYFAITDPLLARLPVDSRRAWRIGHFVRAVPQGYVHARATGDTSRMAPPLARYYEKLRIVTSGELLSIDRLYTILGFQLGIYNHWLHEAMHPAAPNQAAG